DANALAATGRLRALSAISVTAVIARTLLRGRSGMADSQTKWAVVRTQLNLSRNEPGKQTRPKRTPKAGSATVHRTSTVLLDEPWRSPPDVEQDTQQFGLNNGCQMKSKSGRQAAGDTRTRNGQLPAWTRVDQ